MRLSLFCPICHSPKDLSSAICDDCRTQLDSECFDSFMSRCPTCLYPKVSDLYVCDRCSNSGTNRVFPVARYDGKLSYSVLDSFKFHGHKEMAPVVAMYLNRALEVLDPSKEAVIVPVPCSRARLDRFGWDQMVEVAKHLKRPYEKLLLNADGPRRQQKRLNRTQRLESSELRFTVDGALSSKLQVQGSPKIIVIDDIITTMSTMNSAIEALKKEGFCDVSGASWLCEL